MTPAKSKICHMSSGHEGLELRIFQKECISLAKKYDVTLIIPKVEKGVSNNVNLVPFRKYSSTFRRFLFAPFSMFWIAYREKACVYHFHDPELILTGLLLKCTKRAKIIYDVHEDVSGSFSSRSGNRFLRMLIARLFGFYQKAASRFFDVIVCVTDTIAAQFEKVTKPFIIYNYPVLERFVAEHVQKDGSVVFFGNMGVERGIYQICEAAVLLNTVYKTPLKLKLIGRVTPECVEADILNKYGDVIDYTGWINIEKSYQLVQRCSVGLVTYLPAPNHDYCLPNKMFEYMNFGMPVVCSDLEEMKKIVEGHECGFAVNPHSPEQIAEAIHKIITSPALMKQMGINGQKAVNDSYNWLQMESRLYDIYEPLIC